MAENTKTEYWRLKAQERREKGLCRNCNNPAEPGKSRCRTCLDSDNERAKARYTEKANVGD